MGRREESSAESERTCAVTGEKGPPEAMIRFALAPNGTVTPDLRRRLPGRGVWTLLSRAVVAKAVKKGAFSRGFKAPARAPDDLAEQVEAGLKEDALQFLAIANKAGAVVAGAAKVAEAVAAGAVGLVTASDAGAEGRRAAARLKKTAARPLADVTAFPSSQLSLALGRPLVIHAALNASEASQAFLARVARLSAFRADRGTTEPRRDSETAEEGVRVEKSARATRDNWNDG